METFPFTDAEWDALKPIVRSILNASLAGDDVLAASLKLDLLARVDELRGRYGDHPVLLETAADYTEDGAERSVLYRQAIAVAEANGLPTLSARLSFAPVLVGLGEPIAALEELRACGGEVADGSPDDRKQWMWELEHVATHAAGDARRSVLFGRATEIAAEYGQPTFRLRLLFIRFLLDTNQPAAAGDELRGCEGEAAGGDDDDRTFWVQLCEEVGRAMR